MGNYMAVRAIPYTHVKKLDDDIIITIPNNTIIVLELIKHYAHHFKLKINCHNSLILN